MAKPVSIERSTVIEAPIEVVWRVSAQEFEHIDRWDGNVKHSRPNGPATGGAPVGGRICDLYGGGQTIERFVAFDPANCAFAYEITKGLPGFVTAARNTWRLEALAGNTTRLTMRVDMGVKGLLGAIMRGPMTSQMGKVLTRAQDELKHYVETGEPHPRKRKKAKK
ncbi:MAG: SRPBCC family protein [Pseudomonadota bacterium]